jgi:hypothetical protein
MQKPLPVQLSFFFFFFYDLDEMNSYAKSTARAIGKVTTSIGIGNGNP